MFYLAIGLILLLIAIFQVLKDELSIHRLKRALEKNGHRISCYVQIPDIKQDNKPYCFLIDKINRKWFLSNYNETSAKAYDFSDITDYKIIFRQKGSAILKGNEFSVSGLDFYKNGLRIFDEIEITPENCEYIEFNLIYSGKALESKICNCFVLYENQRGLIYKKNHDFTVPSSCIEDAKSFENILYEIIFKGTKVTVKGN